MNAASGADIVSGGAGSDTISFQSELGDFVVDLQKGYVTSNRGAGGSTIIEDVIGQIGDDGAGGTIFSFTDDVENATGGFGNDTLIGNAGDNVLTPGGGNNVVNGQGGNDTLVLDGTFASFVVSFDAATSKFTLIGAGGTTVAENIETFRFTDVTRTALELRPGPEAVDDAVTLNEDGSIVFNPIGNDLNAAGTTVTAINGTAIALGGPLVDVLNGKVSLSAAGLSFVPAPNYFGPASFTYTISDGVGRFATATVNVTINNVNDAPTDVGFNGSTATTAVSLAENSANGSVVATLSTIDIDNVIAPGTDVFTYTLADNFGAGLQSRGTRSSSKTARCSTSRVRTRCSILSSRRTTGHGGSTQKGLTVNLTNVNEGPTNIATTGLTFSEAAANGTVIGTLSATDPEGDAIRFALLNDAGGRFKLLSDIVGGNVVSKLALAENLLTDHLASDANHTYQVQVQATDRFGASTVQTFTLTATGVVENHQTFGGGNDTITGSTANGGNGVIDGGAGRDTMTGGAGNDFYIVDNSGDKVVEASGGGTDAIYTSLTSFDLNSAANVEGLIYTGTGNFSGKASNIGNTLIGNSALIS